MKTSSSLNTPQMSAVRSQLASQEASMLDGALAELQQRRELERMMSERAAEAHRQQQLIQAARDAEREMIQHLAEEAATQRRAEHELAVATADQDDLSNEAHRAIGALPKQSHRGPSMSNYTKASSPRDWHRRAEIEQLVDDLFEKGSKNESGRYRTYTPHRRLFGPRPEPMLRLDPQGDPIPRQSRSDNPTTVPDIQEVQQERQPRYNPQGGTQVDAQGNMVRRKARGTLKKGSQVRDAALVGYEMPGQGSREVYLESRDPTKADRMNRALMGGGGGLVGGALGGLGLALLGKGRGIPNALKGGLGLGTLGAALGAAAPMPVRTAYDPDYGTQLSEAEERRAAAVQRALMPGNEPSNIAMQQPGTTFGGPLRDQAPSFSYAADIDDMMREDPAMAQALVGKVSGAQKKTPAYDNAPELTGGQRTQLPDRLQKEIIKLEKKKKGETAAPAEETKKESKKYSEVTRTRRGVKSAYEKAKRDGRKRGMSRKNSPHGHRREESN